MALTPRETILKAFAMEKPERVPVTVFGGGMGHQVTGRPEELRTMDKNVDMCVTEAEKIRSDIVYVGSGFNNFTRSPWAENWGWTSNTERSVRLTIPPK
jgi:hypothetical protein